MLHTAVWLKYCHETYVLSFCNAISSHENVSLYDFVGLKVTLSLMVLRRRRSNLLKDFLVKQTQMCYRFIY